MGNVRLGSNGSEREEMEGEGAPQSISSTEGGERGSRREVFRDIVYMCPWYSVDVVTNHQGQRKISS